MLTVAEETWTTTSIQPKHRRTTLQHRIPRKHRSTRIPHHIPRKHHNTLTHIPVSMLICVEPSPPNKMASG